MRAWLPICAILSLARPAAARDFTQQIEFGGGVLVPFAEGHRSAYGAGGAFSLGWAPRLGTRDAFLICEIGLLASSGQEFRGDPTFEQRDSKYWLVPIDLGIRADLGGNEPPSALHVYVGAALQTVWTRWQGPFGQSFREPAWGLLLELRPQYPLGGPWSLWLRTRLSWLSDVNYDGHIDPIDYSGNNLQIGLSLGVR